MRPHPSVSDSTEIAQAAPSFGRISLRTLVPIRWIAVAGQAVTLVTVHFVLGYRLPLLPAFGVVACSALLNIFLILHRQAATRLSERDAALYLGYDTLQLAALLYLTGGLQNPFAMLILATLFIALYTWSVAQEARRLRDAVAATQLALAREQQVSAVGSLAAAAAHELGSPLATIAVVAKELARELPSDSPYAEDAALLVSQSERCRKILAQLTQQHDEDGGSPYARLPISALVEAAMASHNDQGVRLIFATTSASAENEPLVRRSPEILHGLNNLIQNAVQFARREVSVTTSWDAATVTVEIADDGPGFPLHLLNRLGEPYLSTRAGEANHMGLGIFIAQSLLERSGARLSFANLPEGGAHVAISWDRANLEAVERIRPSATKAYEQR